MLINRIKDWYNSQIFDMQNGFCQGCGTTDSIHITKTTQLIAEKTNEQIYAIFIALKAAFDHNNRNWLFQSIRNRLPNTNQDNKIINLFDALYQSTTAELKKTPSTRVTIFSLRKRRTGSLRIITSADVQFSSQNQVKTKKKSSRPKAGARAVY